MTTTTFLELSQYFESEKKSLNGTLPEILKLNNSKLDKV